MSVQGTGNFTLCISTLRRGPGVEIYSAPFRQFEQLFVCFFGCAKEHPVTKQRLSKGIVDAIMLAYSPMGLQWPIGIRAH